MTRIVEQGGREIDGGKEGLQYKRKEDMEQMVDEGKEGGWSL